MTELFPVASLHPTSRRCVSIMVLEGWGKLRGDCLHGTPLSATLANWLAADKPFGFFVPMVNLAYAHPKIFGALVTIGELTVGLSMLFGVLTHISAVLGALMVFSFALGGGQGFVPP